MTGLYVVGIALVLALGFGLYRKAVDGRVRPARAQAAGPLGLDAELGDTATFVQFSSAACAPCRVTARVLDEVSTSTEGVAHIEIDAEQRLDLVGELGITRTPTVLVLDASGVVRSRMVGAPRRQDVLAALAGLAAGIPSATANPAAA
ncbi:MAG TPA: thioredoxin family protein [Propionicimonas sp.]|uniref:thioredoxin family protein n=1 Tax=Propionicimonas sp. TaxID=1955623 RepID=UPI002F3F0458